VSLESESDADRASLALALLGPLSRSKDPTLLVRTLRLARASAGPLRDALIEAAGGMPSAGTGLALASFSEGAGASTRAKVAEALKTHGDQAESLKRATADPDASVRANAVWSLGFVARSTDLSALQGALGDQDAAVAANGAAALAQLAQRLLPSRPEVISSLCASLEHSGAYVRANALAGLGLLEARCVSGTERWLLARDPEALVRGRAAQLLRRAPSAQPDQDAQALERCREQEVIGAVASACAPSPPDSPPSGHRPLTVFVVPPGAIAPEPQAPFALVLPNGLVRLGLSDSRGVVYEALAPRGRVSLSVPATYLKVGGGLR
jgi:hypothetical protein